MNFMVVSSFIVHFISNKTLKQTRVIDILCSIFFRCCVYNIRFAFASIFFYLYWSSIIFSTCCILLIFECIYPSVAVILFIILNKLFSILQFDRLRGQLCVSVCIIAHFFCFGWNSFNFLICLLLYN